MSYILNQVEKYQNIFIWLTSLSVIILIIGLFFIPFVLKKIPIDYFTNPIYHQIKLTNLKQKIIFTIKNILGLFVIIIGIIMLFVPGPGIISILVGLFLMDFKGKYYLEKKIIQNNTVFNSLNWIRKKAGDQPFKR